MPYIKESHRKYLEDFPTDIKSSGELNYQLTNVCLDFLQTNGESYATINSIIGALECAKLEFYRRIAIPYEEIKMKENGDVYK